MAAVAPLEVAEAPREQRMLLHGVSWKEYVVMRDLLDGPALKMTYVRGALELMSPSPERELWKKNIARLVELYAHVKRIDLHGYGSTTFKKEAAERGAEPDECYREGAFKLYVLDAQAGRYEVKARSALVPSLDFEVVARYARREDTPQALREFEGEIGR
jgi:Uma2 family endonuclease